MMNMHARNQYLHSLISKKGGYHLQSKKEKGHILNEYCRVTGQHRTAVSAKIRSGAYVHTFRTETGREKRIRRSRYTKAVVVVLIRLWRIFDYPCGQRLVTSLRQELDRLRRFGEVKVSDEMTSLLTSMSARTIDTKLAPHKEKMHLARRYAKLRHPLLYEKIPVKLSSDQGRGIGDTVQIDLVEQCGQSADGEFVYAISATDIGTGWWEGGAVLGRGAEGIMMAVAEMEGRCPFPWVEIHTDNDTAFINAHLFRYTERRHLGFSRSRPYMKNDNCFIEQKNGTHVRRTIGHRRYDTAEELSIIQTLFRTDLRLYKNFFQPIIPLLSKERIGGKVKRRYGTPQTPYKRVMMSSQVSAEIKKDLTALYETLNPAELKRNIERHQDRLFATYKTKQRRMAICIDTPAAFEKKLTPHSSTFLIAEPIVVHQ